MSHPPVTRPNLQRQQWVDLQPGVVWSGEIDDFVRLLHSVGANCACRTSAYASRGPRSCPAHQLLADQQVLDHLVFGRRMRQRFIRSEWTVEVPLSDSAYMRLLRRLTNSGQARQVGSRLRRWRPGAFAYALAGLAIVLSLHGTLPQPASRATPPVAAWSTR